jgi:hypothetical protein
MPSGFSNWQDGHFILSSERIEANYLKKYIRSVINGESAMYFKKSG